MSAQPTARLIAALRMVLPLVDSDGQAWQSEEIRAAIAEGEAEQQGLGADLNPPRGYGRDFRPMPETVPALELVPTEEELLAADRARAAFKEDQRYFAMSDSFSLSQQNRGVL